jgi:hypothetical protein
MNRAELLERIRDAKSEVDGVVDRIPGARMEEPGRVWSPKDQLSHLAAWHEILLARIEGRKEEEFLGIGAKRYAGMDIDEINDFLHKRVGSRSPQEAREAFERSYQEVLKALEAVDEDDLYRDYRPEIRQRLLIDTVIGNTYEHYEEHLPIFRDFAPS